ncbi:MAG: membrane-bound lytic murein transglycosylase F [Lentisphaeria bacterium]|jgi:membrane-bound lytic murein transglycosylase F
MAMMGLLVVATGSLVGSREPTVLESVIAKGQLHVISRNGPTTYYEGPNGYTGFEYTLASRFAQYLGVELVIHGEDDLGKMINAVDNNQVQFAAAGLPITEKRKQRIKFSTPYLDITQKLIYQQGQSKPRSAADLVGKKIIAISNSAQTEGLRRLQREYPGLAWQERNDLEMLDLLEMVHNGDVDFAVVDSKSYALGKSVYPNARAAFDISGAQQLAWAFPNNNDTSLYDKASHFFETVEQEGLITDALDTYYGHLGELDYSGAILFAHRIDSRLPQWEEMLKASADNYSLDWQLLAALSYQESHWNPSAKSHTGVRGFMMLTRNTAKEMGIKNRVDAEQSIEGGTKYFKSIHSRIPQRIAEPDRTWLTLAAYNIGMGHMEDARVLTQKFGFNPDKWSDVKQHLLLLSKSKYYKNTKHGYARGWEAVDYVQNIRNFHTIIAWNEKDKQDQLASNAAATQHQFAQFSSAITDAVNTITVSSL